MVSSLQPLQHVPIQLRKRSREGTLGERLNKSLRSNTKKHACLSSLYEGHTLHMKVLLGLSLVSSPIMHLIHSSNFWGKISIAKHRVC